MSQTDFTARMSRITTPVESRLAALLTDAVQPGEAVRAVKLMAAMRHGTLDGGKRLRPFLVLEAARFCGGSLDNALDTACSLEMIHCYSLIHDDLPAMDDDDLRRGRPTVHRAYDDATAILAGDALLTLAFETVAADEKLSPEVRVDLVRLLAQAAGLGGMIGGQMLDMEAETQVPGADGIRRLQAMKTGALIRFACEAGAMIAGTNASKRAALVTYGKTVGLAFQLADDVLDVTASAEAMGKATGKDADAGKATLVGLHGIDAVKAMLEEAVAEAEAALDGHGDGKTLVALARFVATRKN